LIFTYSVAQVWSKAWSSARGLLLYAFLLESLGCVFPTSRVGCELTGVWGVERPTKFSTSCAFYIFSPLPTGSIMPLVQVSGHMLTPMLFSVNWHSDQESSYYICVVCAHLVFGGRLKTRDWKPRDHNTGGGKRETISYGTPNWQV